MKKTEAQKIMEARHSSYAIYPNGYMDETDLLLMSQHFGELKERKKSVKNLKKGKSKISQTWTSVLK